MSEHSKSGIRNGKLYVIEDHKWVHIIMIIIATPFVLSVISCHCYKTIQRRCNSNKNGIIKLQTKFVCPIQFLIVSSLLNCIVLLIFNYVVHFRINFPCNISFYVIACGYVYNKSCINLMGILRLLLAFQSSSVQYSNKLIITIFIIVVSIQLFGFTVIPVYGESFAVYNEEHNYYWCQNTFSWGLTIILSLIDISINAVLLVLFLKPLIRLSHIETLKNHS